MEKIKIPGWPGTYYYDRTEVLEAETDGRVLYCLADERGNKPYSLIRCNRFAETEEGKETVDKMRGIYEGRGDKEKGKGKSGKIKGG